MATLTEATEKRRADARKKFIELAWQDSPDATELARLAGEARLSDAQAERLTREIDAAKPEVELADKLKHLRAEATKARKSLQEIRQANEAEIERLEAEIEAAGRTVSQAQKLVDNAEVAANQLAGKIDLIPAAKIPAAVLKIIEDERAEAEKQESHRRWTTAKKAVVEIRQAIYSAQKHLEQMQGNRLEVLNGESQADIKKRIEKLNERLKAAGEELKAATEAARAAGHEV